MININYNNFTPEPRYTLLRDIPTGTTFTGKIAHFKYRLFLKFGPRTYMDDDDRFGTSGYIMALDKEPTFMTYDSVWDSPDCKVQDYVPVNVELVVTPIN